MTKYKKGKVVRGTVTGIENYGIFISLDEYYSGLIHISEISHGFVKDINNFVKIGETIYVEILDVDEESCHLKLSIKNIVYKVKTKNNKKKIIETKHGFHTLAYKLPGWIDQSLKKFQNNEKI
ncbi:MAG: S1 RNA-binding domain-containing protein [Bacilli bacterium]|jgi:general stress protein 13|nr:S1 RNA-binding domain-containing protein [Bacilli bacterium]